MDNISQIKFKIARILKKNKVIRAGIFGSYARGEQKEGSDIDILIEVKGRKFSLLDMVRLELELEKVLGTEVDLLTYKSVNLHLKKYIFSDEVRII